MQRANDELQEEVDTLKKQATFLHNRLRQPCGSGGGGGVGTSGSLHYHRSLTRDHMSLIDNAVELSDDDDDSSVDLGFDYVLQQQQQQLNNDDDSTTANNAIATSTSSPLGSS